MVRSTVAAPPSAMRAFVFMVLATLFATLTNAGIRHITADVHPFVVTFFRSVFGFVVLIPVFFRYGLAPLVTRRPGLHALRGALQLVQTLFLFTALGFTPLATVAALHFTAPLFTAVMAVVLLGEAIRIRRVSALIVGFAGALIIVRPGMIALDAGPLLVLGSAAFWGAIMVVIKTLTRIDSSLTVTLYTGVFMTPFSFLFAVFIWETPDARALAWLLAVGVSGTLGQLALAQAFREADTTAVLPLDFLKLIWAAAIGYALFAEVPSLWTWIGGAVIFASAFYLAVRERTPGSTRPAAPTDGPRD
ncbi:MAG: DMT family transporter [Rhodospirillales bacterium]|nr:DMT family transporter [Rhodospirillales bacterium]